MILDCISCTILIYSATGLILFLVWLHIYLRCTTGTCTSKVQMNGKTIIITGCTSGIGKETLRDLANRGARIIMACRNMDKANKLKDDIVKETNNSNIVVRKLDVSSLQSVREFAQQINQEENRLDVLIHNAGTAEMFEKMITKDGLEMTMATNYFGPFLLTHLLIDLLKRSKPSRIVIVASELYKIVLSLNLNNLNPTKTFPAYIYYMSKYVDIIFTLELHRRLENTGVTVNCLHPGMIDSEIWRSVPAPLSWFLYLIIKCFFKTPVQGAQTSIYVAIAKELDGISGKYFMDCAECKLKDSMKNPTLGKKLWELTESLVNLQPSDPKI